ncbi:T9SS type A sorting domain-containing protein [Cryomorpha ignava]|uniref:T9SS type A sorting domain-containing protein n=1 Tax=Cryomorpha ignava TaxID=101383 RepID=A0A7K3WTP7_9FLAO|nr:T9SS type A sorting domain-containing protein [Cryomorpha ignava]NEN25067.1 T9SS type A sorting domain-containing protein [Cryomorpha ignava]
MRKIILLSLLFFPVLVFSQTNQWWEHTNIQTFINLSNNVSLYSLPSATDTVNDVQYVVGVSTPNWGDVFYEFNGEFWLARGFYFGDIFDMCYYKGYVYAASSGFNYSDSVYTFSSGTLSRFDGEIWENIPNVDGAVRGLEVIDDTLYVGGEFTTNGFFDSPNVAKFDGENWHPVANNPFVDRPNYAYISCFAKYNGEIYMGGLSPDVNDPELFVYRDNEWQEVGEGIPGLHTKINFLEVYQGELYAAGVIWQSEGNAANAIQKWDGESWSSVGVGLNTTFLYIMRKFQDGLYVGGPFNSAGSTQLDGVARWDGSKWCGLRTYRPGQIVSGMFEFNNSLYMPLFYSEIDPFFSSDYEIYKWIGGDDYNPCSAPTAVEESNIKSFSIFPNPTTGFVKVESIHKIESIEVYNIRGQRILKKNSNNQDISFDLSEFPSGIYLFKINYGESYEYRKIVKH